MLRNRTPIDWLRAKKPERLARLERPQNLKKEARERIQAETIKNDSV